MVVRANPKGHNSESHGLDSEVFLPVLYAVFYRVPNPGKDAGL